MNYFYDVVHLKLGTRHILDSTNKTKLENNIGIYYKKGYPFFLPITTLKHLICQKKKRKKFQHAFVYMKIYLNLFIACSPNS